MNGDTDLFLCGPDSNRGLALSPNFSITHKNPIVDERILWQFFKPLYASSLIPSKFDGRHVFQKREEEILNDSVRLIIQQDKGLFASLRRKLASGNKINDTTKEILGVESTEDFLNKMCQKTTNQRWLQSGYELDHIWQQHWFWPFFKKNYANKAEILRARKIIHSHRNLRPVTSKQNSSRARYDPTPLKEEDFFIYKPYLSDVMMRYILAYFELIRIEKK